MSRSSEHLTVGEDRLHLRLRTESCSHDGLDFGLKAEICSDLFISLLQHRCGQIHFMLTESSETL